MSNYRKQQNRAILFMVIGWLIIFIVSASFGIAFNVRSKSVKNNYNSIRLEYIKLIKKEDKKCLMN